VIQTTAAVIGAGHAGLAMSRRLTERCIDHVVLERGEVANSWRTQRWPSLRLLTPNWQTRLPGHDYAGDDPDGFMTADEVVDFVADYAKVIAAPVQTGTTVTSVRLGSRLISDVLTTTIPPGLSASSNLSSEGRLSTMSACGRLEIGDPIG